MNLPIEIIREILEYLPNEGVFSMEVVDKHINSIYTQQFIEYIKYRDHPLVFNNFDNLCKICNLRLLFLCDPLQICRCNHISNYL